MWLDNAVHNLVELTRQYLEVKWLSHTDPFDGAGLVDEWLAEDLSPEDLPKPEPVPEPPPELLLYWQMQRFNSLLYDGALMNQPHILMRALTEVGNVEEFMRDAARTPPEKKGSQRGNPPV